MPNQSQSDDLCSLGDVKSYVFRGGGTPTQGDDDLLQRMITGCSEFFRKEAGTNFDVQTYSETRSGVGYGQSLLFFKYRPCISVASLWINGVQISARAAGPQNFNASGYSFTPDRISLSKNFEFSEGTDNVSVTYQAGYAAVPPDLRQACIVTVGRRYREIDRLGQKSKSLAGEVVAFDLSDLDDFAQRTVDRYKRVIPIL